MARKPISASEPDRDDLDGQGGAIVSESGASNGTENGTGNGGGSGSIDPTSLVGGSGNDSGTDEYARNSDGSIKRNKDGSPQRKRGRKAGGSNSGRSFGQTGNNQNLRDAIDSLASMIGFVHIGIAAVSKCPEIALDDSESKALAGATAKVMEQFDMTPDPRITAVVGLLTTAGTIYVPRYYLITTRLKKERKEKKDNVVPFQSGLTVVDPLNDPGNFPMGG